MAFSDRFRPSFPILLLLSLFAFAVRTNGAESVTLTWVPNPEPDIAGYRLYYGTTAHSYRQYVDTSATKTAVSNLIEGTTYFFAATATIPPVWKALSRLTFPTWCPDKLPPFSSTFPAVLSFNRAILQ